MLRAVGVAIVMLGLLASCKKRDDVAAREAPPPEPDIAPVHSVDEMIRRSFEQVSGEYFVSGITIDYVRSDGALDPTYGTLSVATGKRRRPKPAPPPPDPNRPLGAPEPPAPVDHDVYLDFLAKCPEISWANGRLRVVREGSCSDFGRAPMTRPRCTVFGILAAAAAAGAPPNALARIEIMSVFDGPPLWTLTIEDKPRDVYFQHQGKDDCEPIVEKP